MITKQRFERVIIRQRKSDHSHLECPVCGLQDSMISIEQCGFIFPMDTRVISRLLEEGSVHSAKPPSGQMLVCIASLLTEIRKLKE